MDFLRLPNLYTRAIGYLKYLFMNRVLGMSAVANPAMTPREVFIFGTYGISAFMYRVFLYTSIVMGVYYRFDKFLGISLALLAFSLFIVRPLFRGSKTMWGRRGELSVRAEGAFVLGLLVVLILAVLLTPISGKSVYSCYVASTKCQKLTVPLQTFVSKVMVREGTFASEGELLFTLDQSLLQLSLDQKVIKRDMLITEMKLLLLDEKRLSGAGQKEIEIAQTEDDIRKIKKDILLARDGVRAPFDGVVTNLDPRVQDGFQPGEGTVIGEFESLTHCIVRGLVPEKDLHKLSKGQEAEVWFTTGTGLLLMGVIDEIRPYSEHDIKNLPFSSRFGGEMATEVKGEEHADVPLEAYYQCSIPLHNLDQKLRLGMTGTLFVRAPGQSLLESLLGKVGRAFNREALF